MAAGRGQSGTLLAHKSPTGIKVVDPFFCGWKQPHSTGKARVPNWFPEQKIWSSSSVEMPGDMRSEVFGASARTTPRAARRATLRLQPYST